MMDEVKKIDKKNNNSEWREWVRDNQLEKALQTNTIKALKETFENSYWFKVQATQYGRAGCADLVGSVRGYSFFFELKSPKKYAQPGHNLSKLQCLHARAVLASGAAWACITSVERAIEIVTLVLAGDRSWEPAEIEHIRRGEGIARLVNKRNVSSRRRKEKGKAIKTFNRAVEKRERLAKKWHGYEGMDFFAGTRGGEAPVAEA